MRGKYGEATDTRQEQLASEASPPCVDWPFSLYCLNLSDGQDKNFEDFS